ncbi:MAG: hypothetical protein QF921_14455 [Pseudomonadales bacterium]|jgi:hypothetical protein|nr:hypothetical protein [Pseudomonadales bacterium]MDP6472663.1 hypothetical protein [Pseudomonadales bacterium]MDP6827875.1 hypothetical protein [Pseudomonadales bacterium]MDP6972683.1 hypothetical protein [Pseudomonadales bacterium]|tara:strand:- start:228 stop:737 length:510 start_codon:yes stop_codon:yes gene_type:complete
MPRPGLTNPNPVSPFGLWCDAREFLAAATEIYPLPATAREIADLKYSGVAYYLLGHSIELSLKAFLLCRGISMETLRRDPYGHSLIALRKESSRRKLGTEVVLTRPQKAVIDYFSDSYASKRDEYFERAMLSVPRYAVLHVITTTLVDGLRTICRSETSTGPEQGRSRQ